ncbi:carbohydrate binding domain-containing protein [Candidatus Daviesbacteria bacterium]|nr:carbohydrate binding domain-containing protein [Candidatus Daviesbacteria bacterium]
MLRKIFAFLFIFLFFFATAKVNGQSGVYQDYRADYRPIPAYGKTVQWIVEPKGQSQTIYFRQNLGFSEDETAFIVPIKGENVNVNMEDKDVWKEVEDKTKLSSYFAEQIVSFALQPKIYTKSDKEQLLEAIKSKNYDIDNVYRQQIDNWFNEGLNLLFFAVEPVKEPRITWTKPLKIELNNSTVEIPLVWLRPEYSKITTAKNKVVYAADFEGGNGGWQDEFQGEGANSLVTRDNSEHYDGDFSLKVQNKPKSINALSTQTLGPLTPGEHYTFSAYVENGTITSGNAFLRVMGDGLVQFNDGVPMYNGLGHEWQRISMTFQARSAYHFFTLMAGGESGQYLYWDDIQLEKGTTASPFQKDKVGTNNSDLTKEDLVTTSVDTEVMIFGDSSYSTNNPQWGKSFYQLNGSKPTFISSPILSYIRGSINPIDTGAFIQFEKSNDKPQPLPSGGSTTTKNTIPLIVISLVLSILIIIKHLLILFAKVEGDRQSSLIFPIVYFAGWLANTVSISLLSVYYYGLWVAGGNIFDSASAFFLTVFIISSIIYLSVFMLILSKNLLLIKKLSEIQIGTIIIMLVISFSIIISDAYRIFNPPPDVYMTVKPVSTTFSWMYFSKVPPFILLLVEFLVLLKLFFKSKRMQS